jgi:hypothetical protein
MLQWAIICAGYIEVMAVLTAAGACGTGPTSNASFVAEVALRGSLSAYDGEQVTKSSDVFATRREERNKTKKYTIQSGNPERCPGDD